MRPKIREVSFSFFWRKLETIPLVFDNVQKFIVPDIFLFSLVISLGDKLILTLAHIVLTMGSVETNKRKGAQKLHSLKSLTLNGLLKHDLLN